MYIFGRQELLQRPVSSKPPALPKRPSLVGTPIGLPRVPEVGIAFMEVEEVGVADLRFMVPAVHGVDCFRQLDATGLVNTAGVNPDILIPSSRC